MASLKRQLNIRIDDPTELLISQLIGVIEDETGLSVSQSDLFRLGLRELAAKYKDKLPASEPKPKKKPA